VRQLFIDLDGVLADFDGHYAARFGLRPDRTVGAPDPPNFWQNIEGDRQFYRQLPPMADARTLWDGARALHRNPIILTGLPLIPWVEKQKREWVAEHFGANVHVICCMSKDKRSHARAGDVLVDDWAKYRHLWEEIGGIFVLHTSAADSLPQIAAALEEPARV
jgi:5'(3')-deoxyribonucleotidase